jgi:hypothetical protein
VALREMSWQLSREPKPDETLAARWSALLWLLQKLDGLAPEFPMLGEISLEPASQNLLASLKASDELAKRAALSPWTDALSRKALKALVSARSDFRESTTAGHSQARRAERLALALDRLLVSRKNLQPGDASDGHLNHLFKQVQSLPDFNASEFAGVLDQLSRSLDE